MVDTSGQVGRQEGKIMNRVLELVQKMINEGDLSVGEARRELHEAVGRVDREVANFLAGWIMDREDQGEAWAAGDPVTLPCGCRISYDHEQVDVECCGPRCLLPRVLLTP